MGKLDRFEGEMVVFLVRLFAAVEGDEEGVRFVFNEMVGEAKKRYQASKGQNYKIEMSDLEDAIMKKLTPLAVELLPHLESADALRGFFEMVVQAAQEEYAKQHSKEIFNAFTKALPVANQKAKEELDRVRKIRETLENL